MNTVELTTLLQGLVGWGRITIANGEVFYSDEAWEEIARWIQKQHRTLSDRHSLLHELLLVDEKGNPLSDEDLTIILTDCAFGEYSMRELLIEFAQRFVISECQDDLIIWYTKKQAAMRGVKA